MRWLVCDDCGEVFNECQASGRAARLEDGTEPWTRILQCPACNSEELQEAVICPLCGKPHAPNGSDFCDGCRNYTDAALKSIAWVRGEGDEPEKALQELILEIYRM